eukprot:1835356-Rhodomonas_salina.2
MCGTEAAHGAPGAVGAARANSSSPRHVPLSPKRLLCDVRYWHSVWCYRPTRLLRDVGYWPIARLRADYVMSGTGIAYGDICLRACYAMRCAVLRSGMVVPDRLYRRPEAVQALPGTDIDLTSQCTVQSYAIRGTEPCYGIPSTEMGLYDTLSGTEIGFTTPETGFPMHCLVRIWAVLRDVRKIANTNTHCDGSPGISLRAPYAVSGTDIAGTDIAGTDVAYWRGDGGISIRARYAVLT